MLEQHKAGINIENMLEHNLFIAEKAATKAYQTNGILKYDEGVRERARKVGNVAYSSGDMSLALRFLTTEYARPKSSQSQNQNGGQRQNYRRPVHNQVNNNPPREVRPARSFCWSYNGVGCYYESCRYPHICSKCLVPGHSQHSCRNNYGVSGASAPPQQNN